MDNKETLIEQAREFAINCDDGRYFTITDSYADEMAGIMADFAAKIRDEAVAAERTRIASELLQLRQGCSGLNRVSELGKKVAGFIVRLEQPRPSPDTPE